MDALTSGVDKLGLDALPPLTRDPTYSPLLDQSMLTYQDAPSIKGKDERQQSPGDVVDPLRLKRELEDLTDRLTNLQSSLYEIEEARHSAAPINAQTLLSPLLPSSGHLSSTSFTTLASPQTSSFPLPQSQQSKIDLLLTTLTTHLEEFSKEISLASVRVEKMGGIGVGDGNAGGSENPGTGAGQGVGTISAASKVEGVVSEGSGAAVEAKEVGGVASEVASPRPTNTPSRRRPPRQSTHPTSLPASSLPHATPSNIRQTHLQINRLLTDLQSSWANLVDREEQLREELMEDRLVGVFREGARGAEEAMGSLERARKGLVAAYELVMKTEPGSDVVEVIETALSAMGSWEQKKKFWIAGLTKCFAILDKNLKSRTTVNGEVLRRHSELSAKWRALKIPIAEADGLIPRMKRQVGLLDSRNGGDGEEGDMAECDEGAEELMVEEKAGGRVEQDTKGYGVGLGSPLGMAPRRLGSGIPRAETDSGIPHRARTSTQGSDSLGRPSFETDSSAGSSPARQRTVSGPEAYKTGGSGGKGSGLMNALRKMSIGGSKVPKISPQKAEYATPSLSSSTFSGGSTPRSPQATSETGSSYFGITKREPKFSTPKPKWNGVQKVEVPKAEYDPSFYVDPAASPSGGKGLRSISRRKSGLTQEVQEDRYQRSPDRSRPASPDKRQVSGSGGTPIINRRRSFLPLPTHSTSHRPSSPAFSVASTTPSGQARASSNTRPSAPSPSPGRSRAPSTSDVFSTPPPPVPNMPNREQLQQKEARAAALRTAMQTPEPTLRMNAAKMPFYAGRQPSSGYMASPSRLPSSGTGGAVGPTTPGMDRRMLTPSRTPSRQSMAGGGPPSAFRGFERPGSSASGAGGRAGASTPLPGMRGGLAFVPNKIDDLDMALANLLDEIPNDLLVERVDPPLRRGHLHEGEWRARYAITTGRNGRREYELRLLILNKPGTGPGGKTQKIMIRDGMVSKDLRLFVLDMA